MPRAKTRKAEFVPPHYLRLLAETMNHEDIAKAIGVSPSTVSTNIREGLARKVTEGAAQNYWNQRNGRRKAAPIAVISADAETMAFISITVERAGGKFTEVN